MPEDPEMQKREKGFASDLLFWFAVLFGLIALYVLSAGPVARMVHVPGVMPSPAFEKFYAPLIWICEHSEVAEHAMNWYIHHVWPN